MNDKIDPGKRYQDEATEWVQKNRDRFDERMRLDGKDAEEHPIPESK